MDPKLSESVVVTVTREQWGQPRAYADHVFEALLQFTLRGEPYPVADVDVREVVRTHVKEYVPDEQWEWPDTRLRSLKPVGAAAQGQSISSVWRVRLETPYVG